MKLKPTFALTLGGALLSWLAIAFVGCAQPAEPQEHEPGALADDAATNTLSPEGIGVGFPPYCPRQWTCTNNGNGQWYSQKANCLAACGGDGTCYADANCSLPGCTCP